MKEACSKQMSEFFENIFSKKPMWIQASGALLTDLSKPFDCLEHELLIAKLNAYEFILLALKLIYDYLSYRKQRTRVNNPYSEWLAVMFGISQGSILGLLIFNIVLADLFLTHSDIDITNFANDNTPYLSAKKYRRCYSVP